MSLFPHQSETPHSPQSGESFSEAFLDSSSRTRDSLPEQHRTHFDELRSGILAFCHEFKIPIETLRSKEDFGKQLATKTIPSARMAEVVSLFVQLEHLVVRREPLRETHPEYLEEAERLYHLGEQYTAQKNLLEQVGILKEGVITGIDGKSYPIPTLEQIAVRLFERKEGGLSTKQDQGFTKLLLVPFGMSLDALCKTLKQFLLTYKKDHLDFDLNIDDPLYTNPEYEGAVLGNIPKIIYFPKSFDKDDHQGKTKLDVLEEQTPNTDSSFPGWRVHLFQPSDPTDSYSLGFRGIPTKGKGKNHGEENPRPDFETHQTPTKYLSTLQEAQDDPDSPYHGESGMTPEDWIIALMTHLTETGKSLDGENITDNTACLIGAFLPSFVDVPTAYWNSASRQAVLIVLDPGVQDWDVGIRSSVII